MKETLTLVRSRASAVLALLASLLVIMGLVAPSALAENMRERQWYLDAMQADSMWKVSSGKGVTVAMLDSGVDASVPELRGKVLPGKNFVEPGTDARTDPKGHGTAISLLIAGNGAGGQGVKGLAPDARILPLTVTGSTKESGNTTVPVLTKAIRYAADSDAQIINMSLAFQDYSLEKGERGQLQKAVDYAIGRGKLLLAGSGNDGNTSNDVTYPAASDGVAGVSAIDKSLAATKFSNHGSFVALAAPGEDIPTSCIGKSGYCKTWGTSQATGITSGAAALIWAKHPKWTGNQVLRVMMETAGKPADGKIPSRYLGYGTIRPRYNVLENKGDPGPADVNPLVAAKKPDSPSKDDDKGTPSTSPKGGGAGADNAAEGTEGGGGSAMPWILGAAGAVVVVGGGAFVFLRRRNAQRF
ncbi:S8 family serine peptidase [Streptomyces sp. NPDC019937]|uniref:S8 family serine peptidase n=1 Tax=Streptomyces sp. NPDC019937 TaxID=3154787 RepID=UPI0033C7C409